MSQRSHPTLIERSRRAASAAGAVLLLALPLAATAAANYKGKPGTKDYPLISRYQGSALANSGVINFEHVDFNVAPGRKEAVEGKVFNYYYVGPKDRSDLEVFRNYRQALESGGFKVLFSCEDAPKCAALQLGEHAAKWTNDPRSFEGGYSPITYLEQSGNYPPRYLAARLARPEGDVTVVLTTVPPSSTQIDAGVGAPTFLQVIESKPMETGKVTVSADALDKGLSTEGRIALYGIYFDTGKAEIKPESTAQLDEMAKYLTANKASRVYIVGHTDNQGSLETNLTLSKQRAEAVTAALAGTYKIDAKRLQARGVASLSPVASNAGDAGRAKNRRVEMVEQ